MIKYNKMKKIEILITSLALIIGAHSSYAQNSSKTSHQKNISKTEKVNTNTKTNPFTLVYEGALIENLPGKVNIHPVDYKINGLKILANVYTPPNYDPKAKYPTVVIAHPNGGVKEQVAGLYAQKLAENGYITIAADAAYQGGSEGLPRNTDKPANRIEDIHAMADFISQYQGVDINKLALLGI